MRILFSLLALSVSLFKYSFITGQQLPSPKAHFGFHIGDDYLLASYSATEAYFRKLDAASDRVKMVSIGKTEEGRDQPMLIVTSPENHRNLEKYREIAVRMARAENLSEEDARALALEGKAVVWIDGGLHSTETVGSHQLIETVWQMVSRNDAETRRILDKVIILFVHANPDGHELVTSWYMRHEDPKKRSLQNLPVLYQKYVGHDNNRDFYMFNMKESQNIGRQLFVDWIPQIMYNHHQRGPAGTVLAGPPYRDPFNYVFDPLVITGIDAIGAAMYNRLNAEGKPGFTRLGGSVFSTWYNGGLRTTTYFHNMIGLLTELAGGPTPEDIVLVPDRLIPDNNTPYPVGPQKWHFRQSIDYSVSLNYSVLDFAARHSDELLYNIYRMGKNSIERGSRDYWTPYPKRIRELKDAHSRTLPKGSGLSYRATVPSGLYDTLFSKNTARDPRGYIISSSQKDFPTAVKFVNTLIRGGIKVEKADKSFTAGGKEYPEGSFIVRTAQAFRPHVLDMFEPQDYPNDFAYPGGPPVAPYDAAGWTLAYQMGVEFDRFQDNFDGPFRAIPYGEIQKAEKTSGGGGSAYLLSVAVNESFLAVNRLLKEGAEVYRVKGSKTGKGSEAGAFYVSPGKIADRILPELGVGQPIPVRELKKWKQGHLLERIHKPLRIALWDTYGGSMPSGWTRWLLEQFDFDFDVVYPKTIDEGNLISRYDVLIFATRAIPAPGSGTGSNLKEEDVPEAHRFRMGSITAEKSIPRIKAFLEAGGKVIAIGSSTNLAYHLELPVWNALTEITGDGQTRVLPSEKYYIPGSILSVRVDTTLEANRGFGRDADVYFDKSPVFHVGAESIARGQISPLAWYEESPLRSGWAWGQPYLKNKIAAFEAKVGKGRLYAFGPEITFRAQSHGTFRWLLNQLY
ncbi:MAG: peptidase [Cytophagaceae bacterium SCN 52-12]|nr:MAG: peptidase [Cytophagaceae bacterium SCN 52-12]